MKYELIRDNQHKFRWHLVGDNNSDILADSGQGYSNKSDCLHGISQAMKSSSAPIHDEDGTLIGLDGKPVPEKKSAEDFLDFSRKPKP